MEPDCKALWAVALLGGSRGLSTSFVSIFRRCISRVTAATSPSCKEEQCCRRGSSQLGFPFLVASARPLHQFPLHHLLGRQCQAGERLWPAGHRALGACCARTGRTLRLLAVGREVHPGSHCGGAMTTSQSPPLAQCLHPPTWPQPAALGALAQGEGWLPGGVCRRGSENATGHTRHSLSGVIRCHGSCSPASLLKDFCFQT